MRTVVMLGDSPSPLYGVVDPDSYSEDELEYAVVESLSLAYPSYHCIVFGGSFKYENRCQKPDLALIARDYSHWFVIEVELVTHSLQGHVVPQVRAFVYGEPQSDCASILARELGISKDQAMTLIARVPRHVAVVANRWGDGWEAVLRSHEVQMLVLTKFSTPSGSRAAEIEGTLRLTKESLGFGTYSARDLSLRFARTTRLPRGEVQLEDDQGAVAWWLASDSAGALWLSKKVGTPDIPDRAVVQLVRGIDGRLWLSR